MDGKKSRKHRAYPTMSNDIESIQGEDTMMRDVIKAIHITRLPIPRNEVLNALSSGDLGRLPYQIRIETESQNTISGENVDKLLKSMGNVEEFRFHD